MGFWDRLQMRLEPGAETAYIELFPKFTLSEQCMGMTTAHRRRIRASFAARGSAMFR